MPGGERSTRRSFVAYIPAHRTPNGVSIQRLRPLLLRHVESAGAQLDGIRGAAAEGGDDGVDRCMEKSIRDVIGLAEDVFGLETVLGDLLLDGERHLSRVAR